MTNSDITDIEQNLWRDCYWSLINALENAAGLGIKPFKQKVKILSRTDRVIVQSEAEINRVTDFFLTDLLSYFDLFNDSNRNKMRASLINTLRSNYDKNPQFLTELALKINQIIEQDSKEYKAKIFAHLIKAQVIVSELGYYILKGKNVPTNTFKVSYNKNGAAFFEPAVDGKFTNAKGNENIYVKPEWSSLYGNPFYLVNGQEVIGYCIEKHDPTAYFEYERDLFYIPLKSSESHNLVAQIQITPEKPSVARAYVNFGNYTKELRNIPVSADLEGWVGSALGVVSINNAAGAKHKLLVTKLFNSSSALTNNIDATLVKFDLPNKFPEKVVTEASGFGDEVPDYDLSVRRDLTDLDFYTIDGEDARDFDDAVYAQKTAKGWDLYVAIADVSYYVRDGSDLDLEARKRTSSIYFPTKVIPMLPESLSNGLCSINPNVKRYTLTARMEIDRNGVLGNFEFFQACIISKHRFTYNKVQEIIDAGFTTEDSDISAEKCQNIKTLFELYSALDRARLDRGALDLDTKELKYEFNDKGEISNISNYERVTAHKLIEELMVITNVAAATFVDRYNVPAPHRVHNPPPEERVERLNGFLSRLGFYLNNYPTSHDYRKLIEEMKEAGITDETTYTQITTSLSRAVYTTNSDGHFGLALEKYAQFTSPIRRYPDLLLHRAIKTIIIEQEKATNEGGYRYSLKKMDELADYCSEKSVTIDRAYFSFLDWVKSQFMKRFIGQQFIGTVTYIPERGDISVSLDDFQIEGSLSQPRFSSPERKLALRDKIKVYVQSVDEINNRVILATKLGNNSNYRSKRR